ncbi:MAG TPA: YmfQ family protein [Clostridiaceae bacterium]|nr:YmfQ family protein [Clostridiaceae bacterium]
MNLIKYMPPFLKEVREFKEIFGAEDIQIEKLNNQINSMLREVIVKTAEDYGLRRYEKIYGITRPAETLEARRMAILLKMNNRVAYTYKWLIQTLNEAIGAENYKITTDFNNYKMNIEIALNYTEAAELLKNDLVKQMPANIELDYRLTSKINCISGAIISQQTYMVLNTEKMKEMENVKINENNNFGLNLRQQSYIDIKECEK